MRMWSQVKKYTGKHTHPVTLRTKFAENWQIVALDWLTQKEIDKGKDAEGQMIGSDRILASFVAASQDGNYILKLETFPHPRKKNNLQAEKNILTELNHKRCNTVPSIVESGQISYKTLTAALPRHISKHIVKTERYYFIVETFLLDIGSPNLSDIAFSILEQKSLGFYQGDIKPGNIRFDAKTGLCHFIDYDQAIALSADIIALDARAFFDWCNDLEKRRYPGQTSWLRHFPQWSKQDLENCLHGTALDIGQTSICGRQMTTNTANGLYHMIDDARIFVNGPRRNGEREKVLDRIFFRPEERVLDIGCNFGLMSHYLCDRGCSVTGVDMDAVAITIADMIAKILQKDIQFLFCDIDEASSVGNFDTICLFSVLHHTKNIKKNAFMIAEACNRILLECRLNEQGKKPVFNEDGCREWQETTTWLFESEQQLEEELKKLFPHFTELVKIGYCDKGRIIYQMEKKGRVSHGFQ